MNRAMFSGVAGMKAHQTKMDVIGNNIANVNTYGYKYQRAVFSDVYYQNISGASAGTQTAGGTNPSSVGYGSILNSVQTQMSTSSISNTGFGMDVAITGEGFIQVMDASGNIFYTKAGLLAYDSNGYLTDVNGSFVLGTPLDGEEATAEKIKLDNIGSVDPKAAEATAEVGGYTYLLSAANQTHFGNVAINMSASQQLPQGLLASATISETGAISVALNAYEEFANLTELNNAINEAITAANDGEPHPAGDFTFEIEGGDIFAGGPLTGSELSDPYGGIDEGGFASDLDLNNVLFGKSVQFVSVSDNFSGTGTFDGDDFTATLDNTDPANPFWELSLTLPNTEGTTTTYSAQISETSEAQTILLKNDVTGEYVEVTNPGFEELTLVAEAIAPGTTTMNAYDTTVYTDPINVTPSAPSVNKGLSSKTFVLEGGTEGGVITLDELTNITIGSDGKVTVTHPDKGVVTAGTIVLANFSNPSGLELNGNNYYSETVNSGGPQLTFPGLSGSGQLKSSSLEMSNVDLSEQMAEMITTQRGFQANSRIITVSDTMLEELINLKR